MARSTKTPNGTIKKRKYISDKKQNYESHDFLSSTIKILKDA